MSTKKGEGDRSQSYSGQKMEKKKKCKKKLINREKIMSVSALIGRGKIAKEISSCKECDPTYDEFNEINIDNDYQKIRQLLNLEEDIYSNRRMKIALSPNTKFGSRSGTIHCNSKLFSPLSRGLQGGHVAVSAFATTGVLKPKCWNDKIIDQIVRDGNKYYCKSNEQFCGNDKRVVKFFNFRSFINIRKTHQVSLCIKEPCFVGKFRSKDPIIPDIVNALELFFGSYDSAVITSSVLNVAIWREKVKKKEKSDDSDDKKETFYIFDSQPRNECCQVSDEGAAHLIIVHDLISLIFIILEKSRVKNEYFILYDVRIDGVQKLPAGGLNDSDEELVPEAIGFRNRSDCRSVLQAGFHLHDEKVPLILRGRGDLVVALAAIIYSKLVRSREWKQTLVDQMMNQAHAYLIDLARVLEKKFDDSFDLQPEELMSDVILGDFLSKIKLLEKFSSSPEKSEEGTIAILESMILEFFEKEDSGILGVKNRYYAIWKDQSKYYLLDPFACDAEGFRLDPKVFNGSGDSNRPEKVEDPNVEEGGKDVEGPKDSEDPKSPKAPEDPKVSKDSEGLKVSEDSRNPESSKDSESPKLSEDPESAEDSKDSKVPTDPNDVQGEEYLDGTKLHEVLEASEESEAEINGQTGACVIMSKSINGLIEILMKNTNINENDSVVIHSLQVLWIKSGGESGSPFDKVIYQDDRNPVAKDCDVNKDKIPRKRFDTVKFKDSAVEFPEFMANVEEFMMTDDEPRSYDEAQLQNLLVGKIVTHRKINSELDSDSEGSNQKEAGTIRSDQNGVRESGPKETAAKKSDQIETGSKGSDQKEATATESDQKGEKEPERSNENIIRSYKIVNPHRLVLQGSKNCLAEEFEKRMRGRQGLVMSIIAIAYGKLKSPAKWRNIDVNHIIDLGHKSYEDTLSWIKRGSPADDEATDSEDDSDAETDDDDDEDDDDDDDEEDDDESTKLGKSFPLYLEVSMLPTKLKLSENVVTFKRKMKVIEGTANPLANLGEAFERYFQNHSELILENKRLFYGLWNHEGKYYVFNSYGSDEEGWRFREHPASFAVTDSINELTDLFYGILEFNDLEFCLHFVEVESIGKKYSVENPTEVGNDGIPGKFVTKFLPITDEDLFVAPVIDDEKEAESVAEEDSEDDSDDDDEDTDEDDTDKTSVEDEEEGEEKEVEDPLLEVEEQDQPDAPETLNLALITGAIKIETNDKVNQKEEEEEDNKYEKLKRFFSGTCFLPPKQTLNILLEAKQTIGSVHSLVSKFSINSKRKTNVAIDNNNDSDQSAGIVEVTSDKGTASRMIKLPPKKYIFSRVAPTGLTPIRAIDEDFVQDEDLDRKIQDDCLRGDDESEEYVDLEESSTMEILPLGPVIRTPIKKQGSCFEEKKRKECKLAKRDKCDPIMEKLVCGTEEILLEMLFSGRKNVDQGNEEKAIQESKEPEKQEEKNQNPRKIESERIGFTVTEDKELATISGNMYLENREEKTTLHFKTCFYSAILCIIAKVIKDVDEFSSTILDQFIVFANKISQQVGSLRYKSSRSFNNIEIFDIKCNVLLNEIKSVDQENSEDDDLNQVLSAYLNRDQSGILVFENASYAIWRENNMFYLFDPYSCDNTGRAGEGFSCLMKFCDLPTMIGRITENTGEEAIKKYRLYSLLISHIEPRVEKKKKKCNTSRKNTCGENIDQKNSIEQEEECLDDCTDDEEDRNNDDDSETDQSSDIIAPEVKHSLIELPIWVTNKKRNIENKTNIQTPNHNPNQEKQQSGFIALRNYNASIFEVTVVENDVTRPELAPFRRQKEKSDSTDKSDDKMERIKVYDRRFKENCYLLEPIDLCVMGWAGVHDPITWGVKIVKGIYEAARDYAFDSLLAFEDSTVMDMTDGLLFEFNIANYTFRVVFGPIRKGKLYATEGWNLAMSLKKIFEMTVYTGAIIICAGKHIGVMKRNKNHFAWWGVQRTKNLQFITTEDFEEFLKLIVQEIDETEEIDFSIRIVTISYALQLNPDCSDDSGMHEIVVPSSSLPQIHRRDDNDDDQQYNIDDIFRPVDLSLKSNLLFGNVALRERDAVKEPLVKRCYFVAILSVMMKRDIVQNPTAGMIDRIIEMAENLYKDFREPKYHTEHILKNVRVLNRVFDFRDCASSLVEVKTNCGTKNFFITLRKKLRIHFKTRTDGILQFTNCCYGFWYSRSTNRYYYLDPYPCNKNGKNSSKTGRSCLFIFSKICDMVHQMLTNKFEHTTGFFIHDFHIECVNNKKDSSRAKFMEDPIWTYLDLHWSYSHKQKLSKISKSEKLPIKSFWNHYVTEVPNLVYSLWGTIGSFDCKFGSRVGKNQAAICLSILAMQNLCQPSQWSSGFLDSAVLYGDCYYADSSKICTHSNHFNLQPFLRIDNNLCRFQFKSSLCGILYGASDKKSLAEILDLALNESSNLLIECKSVVLGVFKSDDDFFAIDPHWIGPPIFQKNHGAVYILRCRNFPSLLYCLTKMLNSNRQLEFRVTPVVMNFIQEGNLVGKRKFSTVYDSPGETMNDWNFIPGTDVVPAADEYRRFSRNLQLAMKYGDCLENLPVCYPRSELNEEKLNRFLRRFRDSKRRNEVVNRFRDSEESRNDYDRKDYCRANDRERYEMDRDCEFSNFPKLVDFVGKGGSCDEILGGGWNVNGDSKTTLVKPVVCRKKPSFILEESRNRFRIKTKEMRLRKFKNYKHRIASDRDDGEQDKLDKHDLDDLGQEETENYRIANADDDSNNNEDVDDDNNNNNEDADNNNDDGNNDDDNNDDNEDEIDD